MSKVQSGVAGIGTALTSTVMEVNDDSPDEAVAAELRDSESTAIWDQDDAGGDATEVVLISHKPRPSWPGRLATPEPGLRLPQWGSYGPSR